MLFSKTKMELNIIEETPKRLVFEIKGESHTFCNSLKNELWKNAHVKIASYLIKHPLIGIPKFILETDGNIKPRKALLDASEALKRDTEKLRAQFKKEIK